MSGNQRIRGMTRALHFYRVMIFMVAVPLLQSCVSTPDTDSSGEAISPGPTSAFGRVTEAEKLARQEEQRAEIAKNLQRICTQDELDADDQDDIRHGVSAFPLFRGELQSYLLEGNRNNACFDFISRELKGYRLAEMNRQERLLARPLILLAVSAGVPPGKTLLSQILVQDRGGDWLETLREKDDALFEQVLFETVRKLADDIRKDLQLSRVDASSYGRSPVPDLSISGVRYSNPLLVQTFFYRLSRTPRPLAEQELSDVNLLFATLDRWDRPLARPMVRDVILRNESSWIQSFRQEPVWVQYRLLRLLRGLKGPEIVRELMWLSEYHVDEKMKSLAGNTLENILDSAGDLDP